MIIKGMEKLTLLDYPSKTACLLFTGGCNFRCPFCQNSSLLELNNDGSVDIKEVFEYLTKRRKILDGVCITGGEPLLQKDLASFIKKIKDLGYKVKLDTNGSNPIKLKKLLDENLLDYIAMDIKNDFKKYESTSGTKNIDIEKIKKSIQIIKKSNIEFEFRTTIVKELHNIEDIKNICEYIGREVKYYLQNYRDCEEVFQKGLTGFTKDELKLFQKELNDLYPNVIIRGL